MGNILGWRREGILILTEELVNLISYCFFPSNYLVIIMEYLSGFLSPFQ